MQGPFLQLVADNTDHNIQPLDGLNTLRGMRMLSAVSPGIKCILNETSKPPVNKAHFFNITHLLLNCLK